jgi:hypothetical protein
LKINFGGNNISFKDPRQTMIACPKIGEQTYFKALKMVSAFRQDDSNTLRLLPGTYLR